MSTQDPERATATVAAALGEEAAEMRSNAAQVLTGIADREPSLLDPHIEQIRRAMETDDAVRSEAAEGLANVLDRFPELATPIAKQLIESDSEYSRGDAWYSRRERQRILTLGTVLAADSDFEGSERALSEVTSSLSDRNAKVRMAAATAIRRVAASDTEIVEPTIPALRDRLSDFHEWTRRKAAGALAAALDPADAAPPLVTLVESVETADDPPDPWIALADPHPEYVTELLRKLREDTPDPGYNTRLSIAATMERNPVAVQPVLEDCVADLSADDEDYRNDAAWLLGEIALEHPVEGGQYEEAMRSAVDRPEDFDEYPHRRLRNALEELDEDD